MRYDVPRRTLSVWFLGNRRPYHYLDVPEEVYEELLHADSAGNYFNRHIRHHYGFLH
ncbi:KTSC domain-containing protein [Sinorhizobium meliloti]|nr:KTSC domain-containing protein [Sinorhizobium meliloti]RVI26203.1 KTSC domain-containing protein [Sinorhizobium meliloti]